MAAGLDELLCVAYMDGIAVQSNMARSHAGLVAAAASMGLLTTETHEGSFGRTWRPTQDGYLWVQEYRDSVGYQP